MRVREQTMSVMFRITGKSSIPTVGQKLLIQRPLESPNAGTYSLTVVFNRQKYDGSKWENTGEQDTKQVSFSISQAQTVTATPTPQPNGANQKNAVRTGDTTNIAPFVIILVIATVCIVGVVVYKKKKK